MNTIKRFSKCYICAYKYETSNGCCKWRRDSCCEPDVFGVIGEDMGSTLRTGVTTYFFDDENNQITKKQSYDNNGNVISYTDYEYTIQGYIAEQRTYNADNEYKEIITWEYTHNQILVACVSINFDETGSCIEIKQNADGEIIETSGIDRDGEPIDMSLEDSILIEAEDIDEDDDYEGNNDWLD